MILMDGGNSGFVRRGGVGWQVLAADEDFTVTIPTDATVGTPPEHHASVLTHSLSFVADLTTVDGLLARWS